MTNLWNRIRDYFRKPCGDSDEADRDADVMAAAMLCIQTGKAVIGGRGPDGLELRTIESPQQLYGFTSRGLEYPLPPDRTAGTFQATIPCEVCGVATSDPTFYRGKLRCELCYEELLALWREETAT